MPGPQHAPSDRSAADWLASFAERCGLPVPDEAAVATLLDLAGVAAHASERVAAPIACWLVGQTDLTPEQALELAREI